MNLAQIAEDLALQVTLEAYEGVLQGRYANLGEFADATTDALSSLAKQYGPDVAAMLQPAMDKAVETIKPAVQEALKEQIPMFALITGLTIVGGILLGVGLSKGTIKYESSRRNPRWYRRAA